MSDPFVSVSNQVVSYLPYTVGFVLWTAVVLSAGQRLGTTETHSTSSAIRDKLYPSQVNMLKEPGELHGLAVRDGDYDTTIHKVQLRDGDYYSVCDLRINNEDLATVADALSVLSMEQSREEDDRKGMNAVGEHNG